MEKGTTRLENHVQSKQGVHNGDSNLSIKTPRIILQARKRLATNTKKCNNAKIAIEPAICAKKVPSKKIITNNKKPAIPTITSAENKTRTSDWKASRTNRPEASGSGTSIVTTAKRKCSATNSDLKHVSQVTSVGNLPKKECGKRYPSQDVDAGESSQTVKRLKAATPCQDSTKSKSTTNKCQCLGKLTKKNEKNSSKKKIEKKNKPNEFCVPVVEANDESRVDVSLMLPQDLIVEVENGIYVVVDTNVLLNDLVLFNKVKELKGLPTKCNVILVIPWTVLQELDSIKCLSKSDDKALASNAQKAIKYLHSNFMNCHPRIRGQTVLEASINVGFPVVCNDDRILQCCMQYQKKGGSNRVLLWTNDYNLNNKALVNSVKTCTQNGILATLQDVALRFKKGEGCGNEPDRKPSQSHKKAELAVAKSSRQIQKVNNANAMFSNVKDVMLKCLEPVLRNEMINAFDNLWTKIIIVQPPWTLKDVLHCMLKHWISVFGLVLKSSCQRSIKNLSDQLNSTARSVCATQKDVVSFTNSSLECLLLLEPCLGNHAAEIHKAIRELQRFLIKCDDRSPATVKKDITPENESWASSVGRDGDAEMIDLSEELVVATDTLKTVTDSDVLGVLQIVWEKINEFCGLILDSFNLKHSLRYAKPDVLPTQMESLNFLSRMICDISILSIRMRKMIEHFSEVSATDGTFQDAFWNCLVNFLPNLGFMHLQESQVVFKDSAAFMNFCQKSENRKLLMEGFRQLQEFMTILNECLSMIRNANL